MPAVGRFTPGRHGRLPQHPPGEAIREGDDNRDALGGPIVALASHARRLRSPGAARYRDRLLFGRDWERLRDELQVVAPGAKGQRAALAPSRLPALRSARASRALRRETRNAPKRGTTRPAGARASPGGAVVARSREAVVVGVSPGFDVARYFRCPREQHSADRQPGHVDLVRSGRLRHPVETFARRAKRELDENGRAST
jgi:hypothetical protein